MIKNPSMASQVSGLKNNQPKNRLNKIRKGKKHPVWLIKKIEFIKTFPSGLLRSGFFFQQL